VGDHVTFVGVIFAVAKAVNAELAWIVPRHHRCPGRDSDRGVTALQSSPRPSVHQTRKIREASAESIENQLRRSAVEADNREFHRCVHGYEVPPRCITTTPQYAPSCPAETRGTAMVQIVHSLRDGSRCQSEVSRATRTKQ